MTDARRLIGDFLPIQAISVEASREKSVRKGHISTLHLWWARWPLVACRAAVYGALVLASRFIPENGPDNKKQSLGRANAAKFIERLCKYPGNPTIIKEAQRHIFEAHAEQLIKERGTGFQPVTHRPEACATGKCGRAKPFYVLWRYTYKAAEMDAGEAIVFTYGQNVELDGQNGLSSGSRSLVEKKKGKYRLRDFAERGDDEKLGMPKDDGKAAPLIDVLHRILWLVENKPRSLNTFLDEARPVRARLHLVAQTLAGTALAGRKNDGPEHTLATTPAEGAALKKLVANWRALIEARLSDVEMKTGQRRLFQ